ncbi:hypothetical protein C7271_21330 [filamentous cyanobacterium CCP5]|nr:hypothetical protein C7271_21330 [filamentous cyanobacterium CCP5]
MKQQRRSPRLWLWAMVAIGGFMAGANLVARIQSNNARAGFTTGLLAGSVLVGTVASLHGYQSTKDHRLEASDLKARLNALRHELAQIKRIRDSLEGQNESLNRQLTATTQQAQKSTEVLTQLQKRLVVSEAAVATLNASERSLIEQLQRAEAHIQSLKNAIDVNQEQDFNRGRAYEQNAADQKVAQALKEKTRAIADIERQRAQEVAALEATLAQAQSEIQEWETEFDVQLQRLAKEQENAVLAQVVAEVKGNYEARLKQVGQALPQIVQKRCEKHRQKWLSELRAELEAVTAERDRARQQLAHYEQEFVGLAADVEQLNDSDLHQALQAQVESLQGAIEQKNRVIQDYQSAIADLEAPRLFPGGYEHHRGNILIRHAHAQGIILDALHRSRNTEAGQETYYFAARRPQPPREVLAKLNAQVLKLQHELDSKKAVQFEYDSESLTYRCSIQIFQKRLTRDEIDRKWLKASKFKALVKDACAFRISANKGGSKSPTVRNILGAKLLEGEKFKLRRYDPSAGSRKDYWRIAPDWRSYHDALKMAAEIESLILRRQREKSARQGAEFDWVYYVIDELDNTMSTLAGEKVFDGEDEISAAKVVINAIAKAVKEGEHLQIGIIICTQTPNVMQLRKSEVIDKAFFNNLAQIVVEANVFDYLAASTDQTKSARLATDYRAVYDWCDKENEAITDEARKYRPALFVNKGKREVIELPPLGEFGFDKLDPSQPYDFKTFNAYEYAGARSLDQALLMASKEQVERTSFSPNTSPNPSPNLPQTSPKPALANAPLQTPPNTGTVAVVTDPKILPKAEDAPICPICGDPLKPNGKGRGKYQGLQQFACRSQQHTAQMGGKTYYQE